MRLDKLAEGLDWNKDCEGFLEGMAALILFERKIWAIKATRSAFGIGLKEAKDVIESTMASSHNCVVQESHRVRVDQKSFNVIYLRAIANEIAKKHGALLDDLRRVPSQGPVFLNVGYIR